jgi:transcriptional regulator with GAF, ATPase, and Fis domain
MLPGDDDEVATVLDARATATVARRSFALTIVEGPDVGAAIALGAASPGRTFVGTSPACVLRLTDPKVSRRHLAIDVDGSLLRLLDLGSTNGTRVGGLAVRDVSLGGGEVITLGDTAIRVVVAGSAEPAGEGEGAFLRTVGASAAMRRLYPLCRRLAASDVPVLIEGETGTGKEILAESIHAAGGRASGPFVVCDCMTMAPSLVEAALFGHERGAFTGAVGGRSGFFEQADGGTLLLDEIGDLDLSLQAKLLRAIERSEIRRVGGDQWVKVDVRVMAATRRDLDREIEAGRFRDDLFYRLAIARIELPPLRERRGDVAVLATHFWSQLGGEAPVPVDLLVKLEGYGWPGNVRELRNVIARQIALGDLASDDRLERPAGRAKGANAKSPDAGGDFIEHVLSLDLPLTASRDLVIEDFERRYIDRMLLRHDSDATRAAAAAGVARRYFQLLRSRRTTR